MGRRLEAAVNQIPRLPVVQTGLGDAQGGCDIAHGAVGLEQIKSASPELRRVGPGHDRRSPSQDRQTLCLLTSVSAQRGQHQRVQDQGSRPDHHPRSSTRVAAAARDAMADPRRRRDAKAVSALVGAAGPAGQPRRLARAVTSFLVSTMDTARREPRRRACLARQRAVDQPAQHGRETHYWSVIGQISITEGLIVRGWRLWCARSPTPHQRAASSGGVASCGGPGWRR